MKNHTIQIILPSKFAFGIFEMAVITMNALSGYSKVFMIFNERYVA